MLPTTAGGSNFAVVLPNEQATVALVADLAATLEQGDLITLSGDLGAGKTTFARAMIRNLAGDERIAVPSPTFTLVQQYDLPRFIVAHADLYRLDGPSGLAELGLDDLPKEALVLLEWPDRAAGFLPDDRLDVTLTLMPASGPDARHARITGYGALSQRVDRMAATRQFLEATPFRDARRQHMQGDASTRSYERLTAGDRTVILMSSPRRADGPPIRDGLPYSAIAHLAEDIRPFVAMTNGLRDHGFSAPEIYDADLDNGLLLIEDLGADVVVDQTTDSPSPIEERYALAVDLLVAIHAHPLPDMLPLTPGVDYVLPPYDMDAFLIETELLLDWYLPRLGAAVSKPLRAAYLALWREALDPVARAFPSWVLRDFHSPNLLWLPKRRDVARVGLLDFQDAVIGPAAYDLASLLQDARVDVPETMEVTLLGRYVRARREADPTFDAPAFVRSYATLGAQRASKILGIFARLDQRDGKPQYLRHMPRVWEYLHRALSHPSLGSLNAWYAEHVPALQGV